MPRLANGKQHGECEGTIQQSESREPSCGTEPHRMLTVSRLQIRKRIRRPRSLRFEDGLDQHFVGQLRHWMHPPNVRRRIWLGHQDYPSSPAVEHTYARECAYSAPRSQACQAAYLAHLGVAGATTRSLPGLTGTKGCWAGGGG